jgi:signal transduction histidine kinase
MFRRVLRDPGRLQAAFLGVMLTLATTLVWFGWTLIDQDRELEQTRLDQRREAVAALAVANLERRLSYWRDRLESPASELPAGSVLVRFDRESITPANALIYNPSTVDAATADAAAAALLDAAGLAHAEKRYAAAISEYDRLEQRGAAPAASMPAALAAKLGRITVYERSGDAGAALTEARALASDLDAGRWPVSFASYKHLVKEARKRLPEPERAVTAAEGVADAITWLWDEWSANRLTGRWTSHRTDAGPVLLIWTTGAAGGAALAANERVVEREILTDAVSNLDATVRVSLEDSGGLVFGEPPPTGDRTAIRRQTETNLPWTVRAASVDAIDPGRSMLVVGLGLLVAFVLAGAWFVGRSVTRELEVARLKSDFVAAVSHEFRTPLTTIVQLSELLKRGRIASDADRQAYYDLLNAHGIRLQRLIERLLNFGQVESGRAQYRFVELDAAALAGSCMSEFVDTHQNSGHTFECVAPEESSTVSGDRDALATVLWNLFENAVKYSPDGGRIIVRVARQSETVAISVKDPGVGIPRAEQQRIFEPFVRGEIARHRQIRGTGVGLALSRSIVRAHGGDITVESEPNAGSTFTVTLPVVARPGQN